VVGRLKLSRTPPPPNPLLSRGGEPFSQQQGMRHPRRAVINLLINSIQLILYQRWITLTTNTPRSTIPSGARSSTKAHARTPHQRLRTHRPAAQAGLS
jgi:hypothetical protein